MSNALIIVDVQMDFLPGGALAVANGDEVIPEIQRIAGDYDYRIVTQDYHPSETAHFEKWPVHCVRGTPGVELHPAIAALIDPARDLCIIKGTGNKDDGYSAFEGRLKSITSRRHLSLGELLDDLGVTDVDVVGLAFDYCVGATALDAVDVPYKTRILRYATRAVNPDNIDSLTGSMRRCGIEVIT